MKEKNMSQTAVVENQLSEKEKEIRRIKFLIRNGTLPSRMFVKQRNERGEEVMERAVDPKHPWRKPKLTWRTLDTLSELTKDL
jgi:hypothetical protein